MTKPGPKKQDPKLAWLKGQGPKPKAASNGAGYTAQDDKPIKVPKPPSYFGPHGRRAWRVLYRALMEADMLTAGDMIGFEVMCSAYEQVRLANEALSEHGPLIEGTRGTFVRNPAGIQLRESSALLIKMLDRYGLSPRAAEALGLGVID